MKRTYIYILFAIIAGIITYGIMDYATSNYNNIQLKIRMSAWQKEPMQVFYEFDDVFTPELSFIKEIEKERTPQLVEFEIPKIDSLQRLRIDLGSNKNVWQIYQIEIVKKYDRLIYTPGSVFKAFEPLHDITGYNLRGDHVEIVTSGPDGFIASKVNLSDMLKGMRSSNKNLAYNILVGLLASIVLFFVLYFIGQPSLKVEWNALVKKMHIGAFCMLISLPVVLKYFPGITSNKNKEKREKEETPEFTFKKVGRYPAEYTRYFENSFALRNELITLNGFIKLKAFHTSSTPNKVLVGKNQWLYSREPGIIDDVQHLTPFTENELNTLSNNFKNLKKTLEEKGIDVYLLILPNKYSVYPEYLPNRFKTKPGQSRREQFVGSLQRAGIDVIDPTPDLLAAKKNGELFYLYDTHWNYQGGFIGYTKLIQAIRQKYPTVVPVDMNAYKNIYRVSNNGDLAEQIGLENVLLKNEWVPVKNEKSQVHEGRIQAYSSYNSAYEPVFKEKNDSTLPTMLMFRDSYANLMIPFLSENFKRSVYLWSNVVLMEAIEKERPDIVVFEIVEDKIPIYINIQPN